MQINVFQYICRGTKCNSIVIKSPNKSRGKMLLNHDEFNALNCLIALEQIDIIDDEENEFWNTIRRKLTTNVITEP